MFFLGCVRLAPYLIVPRPEAPHHHSLSNDQATVRTSFLLLSFSQPIPPERHNRPFAACLSPRLHPHRRTARFFQSLSLNLNTQSRRLLQGVVNNSPSWLPDKTPAGRSWQKTTRHTQGLHIHKASRLSSSLSLSTTTDSHHSPTSRRTTIAAILLAPSRNRLSPCNLAACSASFLQNGLGYFSQLPLSRPSYV